MRLARAPLQRSGGHSAPVGSYLYKENVIRHVTLIAKTRYIQRNLLLRGTDHVRRDD